MTTHVFIVDSTTFKIHLEYLFAGTGSKKKNGMSHEGIFIDFNNDTTTSLHFKTEDNLIGMIADTNRIRKNDLIIFYLQQDFSNNIFDGKFFGIFKAKQDWAFLDNYTDNQYLNSELNKSLTFRVLINPHKIYSEGVTEWEALDEIKNIQSPNQMLWSLIYRKLKGNRGNTMITIYESERLCQLIRNKNNRQELNCDDKLLSFDLSSQRIVCGNQKPNVYKGRKEDIDMLPRLIAKSELRKSFEPHLQAYVVKNIGMGLNKELDKIILEGSDIEWLGNEVSCGVGMQRIDVMLSLIKNEQRVIVPIELKAVEADERNIIQIQRYIDWIEQYYIPNRQSDIQPVLVSKMINDKTTNRYQKIVQSFEKFNS
ncbi:DUF91 domain-containing protein, partial [Patescibacteria group bacterium AH-259-L07]|nr:DUF91 domain-containing protein [Patescibacteria group bacterium AH-259-L07]